MPAFHKDALPVDQEHVAGLHFAPVHALRVDQIAIRGQLKGEVVAHALVETEYRGPAQGGSEVLAGGAQVACSEASIGGVHRRRDSCSSNRLPL